MATKYNVNKETVRPFRLWDAEEKREMPHRYYSDPKRAHIGAWVETRWANIGTVIEVLDVSIGKCIGQYKRRVHDVWFKGGDNLKKLGE